MFDISTIGTENVAFCQTFVFLMALSRRDEISNLSVERRKHKTSFEIKFPDKQLDNTLQTTENPLTAV